MINVFLLMRIRRLCRFFGSVGASRLYPVCFFSTTAVDKTAKNAPLYAYLYHKGATYVMQNMAHGLLSRRITQSPMRG
jgi:hypothetical protein